MCVDYTTAYVNATSYWKLTSIHEHYAGANFHILSKQRLIACMTLRGRLEDTQQRLVLELVILELQ